MTVLMFDALQQGIDSVTLFEGLIQQIKDIIYMDLEEDDGAEQYCISDHIDH